LFLCFPLSWFYIVVVPVTTSTLRRWENPEDMDLDEVSLWWSHTNNINKPTECETCVYVMNIHQHLFCCPTCYFSRLSVLLHLCISCWDTRVLWGPLKSFSWHFCVFVITIELSVLQQNSAFSWVCLLSINYRLQNRGNFSGAAYWISKSSGAVKITKVSPSFWNAAVLPRVAPYLWALPSQMRGVLLDCVLCWCLSLRWYYTRCSPPSLCR